jgi:hypothetical protein
MVCWNYFDLDYLKKTIGGAGEDRTPDPLRARQVLSQLSYDPFFLLRHFPLLFVIDIRSFGHIDASIKEKLLAKTFSDDFYSFLTRARHTQSVFLRFSYLDWEKSLAKSFKSSWSNYFDNRFFLKTNCVGALSPSSYLLTSLRRWSSRRFPYGYLVTTSPQSWITPW